MPELRRLVQAQRTGSIINMASQAGRRGEALVAHYCASNAAAVISYTQSAALAMAPHSSRAKRQRRRSGFPGRGRIALHHRANPQRGRWQADVLTAAPDTP